MTLPRADTARDTKPPTTAACGPNIELSSHRTISATNPILSTSRASLSPCLSTLSVNSHTLHSSSLSSASRNAAAYGLTSILKHLTTFVNGRSVTSTAAGVPSKVDCGSIASSHVSRFTKSYIHDRSPSANPTRSACSSSLPLVSGQQDFDVKHVGEGDLASNNRAWGTIWIVCPCWGEFWMGINLSNMEKL